jgi:hemoglobin-like flavoprotein
VLNNQDSIDLVEDSFEQIKQHKAEFSEAFYTRLFADYPELQPLFSNTNVDRQGAKLYAALVLLVENLRHPAELERVLLPLGEKHIGYGATPEAFPKVGATIVATLREFLGDAWSPQLHDAWAETLQVVTRTMLRGAGMSPPEHTASPPPP